MLVLPRLYAIVDAACFAQPDDMYRSCEELLSSGVTLLQYRNKTASSRVMLEQAQKIRRIAGNSVQLIMNDRADLCLAAIYTGCHVGQDDLSPESIRKFIGKDLILGISTHNPEQASEADKSVADYVAVGPVFATASKTNPDSVIGLEGIRKARALTSKPLVAIGGITRGNCQQVIEAGADSVAVIGDLVREPKKAAQEFLSLLEH